MGSVWNTIQYGPQNSSQTGAFLKITIGYDSTDSNQIKRMKTKPKKFKQIDTKDKVQFVADCLGEKQANEITAIDVTGICPIAEIVMVAGAKGVRHAQALADFILEKLSKENIEYLSMEGYKTGDWILLDLNDIIVHIFQEDNRGFYNVEGLWSEGTNLDLNLTPQE